MSAEQDDGTAPEDASALSPSSLSLPVDPKEVYRIISHHLGEASRIKIIEHRLQHLIKAQKALFSVEDASALLDNFLDNFLAFYQEKIVKIQCFVVKFIEDACLRDMFVLSKATSTLTRTLLDPSTPPALAKRIIVTITQLYPYILKWAVENKNNSDVAATWETVALLKSQIMNMTNMKNEGIRVLTMRFLEVLTICQTSKSDLSDMALVSYTMSLNYVSGDHRFISYRQLESEAAQAFHRLLEPLSSSRTSLLHLVSALTAVAHVARARPEFFPSMIEAFESLHYNLPPTLATGQVKSVRKELKLHLMKLLKHPTVFTKYLSRFSSLLQELGASKNEINRNQPDPKEISASLKRRVEATQRRTTEAAAAAQRLAGTSGDANGQLAKRIRLDDEDYDDEDAGRSALTDQHALLRYQQEAIRMTTDWVIDHMGGDVVQRLVMINLALMPDRMPPAFNAKVYQIPEVVTYETKRSVAELMARQFVKEKKGIGAEYLEKKKQHLSEARQKLALAEGPSAAFGSSGSAALRTDDRSTLSALDQKPSSSQLVKPSDEETSAPSRGKAKAIKHDILRETKPLDPKECNELRVLIFKKLMDNESNMNHDVMRISLYRNLINIVAKMHNEMTPELEEMLLAFVIADQKKRGILLILWLDELHAQVMGVSKCISNSKDAVVFSKEKNEERYSGLMQAALTKLFEANQHRELLFHSLFLEVKIITPAALTILKKACLIPDSCAFCISTLRELIINRNQQRPEFLKLMMELSYHDADVIRHESIATTKELYQYDHVRDDIRSQLLVMAERMLERNVPREIWSALVEDGIEQAAIDDDEPVAWSESSARSGLILLMSMIPLDGTLISQLTRICANAVNIISRYLVTSIDKFGMQVDQDDAGFLDAIENCPVGGEALIARFVNVMTRTADPSLQVVEKLKELQKRHNSDVRSLIPIIPGLTTQECLDLVPHFVLNATSIRSVPHFYQKILRSKNLLTQKPPVSVSDLLMKLHSLENISAKAGTLLQSNIDLLVVDSKNEFYEESGQIPSAIENFIHLPTVNQFVFHTLQRLYEKYPHLGPTITKVLSKLLERRPSSTDDDAGDTLLSSPQIWQAFKECVLSLGIFAYSPIVFGLNPDQIAELIDTCPDTTFKQKLRTYIATLPPHEQQKIDRNVVKMLKEDVENERVVIKVEDDDEK